MLKPLKVLYFALRDVFIGFLKFIKYRNYNILKLFYFYFLKKLRKSSLKLKTVKIVSNKEVI